MIVLDICVSPFQRRYWRMVTCEFAGATPFRICTAIQEKTGLTGTQGGVTRNSSYHSGFTKHGRRTTYGVSLRRRPKMCRHRKYGATKSTSAWLERNLAVDTKSYFNCPNNEHDALAVWPGLDRHVELILEKSRPPDRHPCKSFVKEKRSAPKARS